MFRNIQPLHHTWKLVCLCHHTLRGGVSSSARGQGSPRALLSPDVLPKLILEAQLLESSWRRGRKRDLQNSFSCCFSQLQGSTLEGGVFQALLEGARSSWEAAPRADAMWVGQNPSTDPNSSTCLTSLQNCQEHLTLKDKALCVTVFSLASLEDFRSPEASQ